jgi:hypothetical protein
LIAPIPCVHLLVVLISGAEFVAVLRDERREKRHETALVPAVSHDGDTPPQSVAKPLNTFHPYSWLYL